MVWTTGTRQRAITVTVKGIFCAATAGHAYAQVSQPANDTQATSVAVQADVKPDVTLSEIKVKDAANAASVGLVGKRALVQMAGQAEIFPIDMDTLSIEQDSIPDSERSCIFKPEHGEVELTLANAMHQFDA
ncbi:hypothetical protein B0G76_7762 [Paraburkholderia sp. BL23I1N1]|nr:hypothetical protein B0G76_7762 [Paraburkholderia sp. BL23I1N1]